MVKSLARQNGSSPSSLPCQAFTSSRGKCTQSWRWDRSKRKFSSYQTRRSPSRQSPIWQRSSAISWCWFCFSRVRVTASMRHGSSSSLCWWRQATHFYWRYCLSWPRCSRPIKVRMMIRRRAIGAPSTVLRLVSSRWSVCVAVKVKDHHPWGAKPARVALTSTVTMTMTRSSDPHCKMPDHTTNKVKLTHLWFQIRKCPHLKQMSAIFSGV